MIFQIYLFMLTYFQLSKEEVNTEFFGNASHLIFKTVIPLYNASTDEYHQECFHPIK